MALVSLCIAGHRLAGACFGLKSINTKPSDFVLFIDINVSSERSDESVHF